MSPVVTEALRHLGSHDGRPYTRWLGLPDGSAWCLAFALWCTHAALPANHLPRLARCSLFWSRVTADAYHARTFTPEDVAWGIETPQSGDIAIFAHHPSQRNWNGHAALVEAYLGDGRIRTVEGNTSPNEKGDQRMGNTVAEKVRHAGVRSFLLKGFVRAR